MYSIVLATLLTTSAAAPDFGRGCYGCCGGCHGYYSCCCGGCYGCSGGCYGCCGGCYGSTVYFSGYGVGCYGSCYGCWGTCYGCHGCYGCYGCYGNCYGGLLIVPAATVPAQTKPMPVAPKKEEKKSSLSNAADVIVKAPVGVELTVEDRTLPRTSTEETFRTPELEPGYTYTYNFTARVVRDGKTISYTKQTKVQAGHTSTVDFTKLATEGKDVARVTVKLPADARLYVDGVPCTLTSTTRSFNTPDLSAGQRYYYTLKAEVVRNGETVGKSQRVLVEAGKDVTVEFKDLPVRTASR